MSRIKLVLPIFSVGFLLIHGYVFAGQMTVSGAIPVPHGIYQSLRIVGQPTSSALWPPCQSLTLGTIASSLNLPLPNNPTGINPLYYCYDNGSGIPQYLPLGPSPFMYNPANPNIIQSSNPTNAFEQVGIGRATNPILKFGIETDANLNPPNDGSFISLGTLGQGFCLPNTIWPNSTNNPTSIYNKNCYNGPTLCSGPCPGTGSGTRFIWLPISSALRVGTIDGTGNPVLGGAGLQAWNPQYIGDFSTAFGRNTLAFSNYANVLGGESNVAAGEYNFIGNGRQNYAGMNPDLQTINLTKYVVIGGGELNVGAASYSIIVGGKTNQNWGDYSFIGGGEGNIIAGQFATSQAYSVIGGGFGNRAPLGFTTVAGGSNNIANMKGSFIGGGVNNIINANNVNNIESSVIAGGDTNTTSGVQSFIGGGKSNSIYNQADLSAIVGGDTNGILGTWSFIGGGKDNCISCKGGKIGSSNYSVINGGDSNNIESSANSMIGGGANNNISAAAHSVIGGGEDNSIVGISSPVPPFNASINHSVIPGGRNNRTESSYTFAGGQGAKLDTGSDGTFIWDNIPAAPYPKYKDRPNFFLIFPSKGVGSTDGYVGIGTGNPQAKLHVVGNIKARLNDVSNTTGPLYWSGSAGTGGEIGYDIAELTETTDEVEPADVLVIDESTNQRLRKSTTPYDSKVIGVVSSAPAILFEGSELQIAPPVGGFVKGTKPPVTLAGRILCKVSVENGPIQRGDLLTTSSTPGHAMRADKQLAAGAILGKAMEEFNGTSANQKIGTIMIFLTLQ